MKFIRHLFMMAAVVFSLLITACTFQEDITGPAVTTEPGTSAAFPTVSPETSAETIIPSSAPAITDISQSTPSPEPTAVTVPEGGSVTEDGVYDTKDEVALYLYLYEHLPSNYMTKKEAREYGWTGGALHLVVEGMCIGGDTFGNNEGSLPEASGRKYHECDINTLNKTKRGSERIIYSNDGLIYYTGDHYETFELLYGDE